jgi:hypothetical protein
MRAWSTIVASGPCLVVNLSASVTSERCPIGNNLRRLPIHAEDYVAGVRFACHHAPCTHD